MFSSRLLNSLVRTHPAVPLVLWGPVILALAVFGRLVRWSQAG
jgi:hypothetical protein